jgi:hypothetical protein
LIKRRKSHLGDRRRLLGTSSSRGRSHCSSVTRPMREQRTQQPGSWASCPMGLGHLGRWGCHPWQPSPERSTSCPDREPQGRERQPAECTGRQHETAFGMIGRVWNELLRIHYTSSRTSVRAAMDPLKHLCLFLTLLFGQHELRRWLQTYPEAIHRACYLRRSNQRANTVGPCLGVSHGLLDGSIFRAPVNYYFLAFTKSLLQLLFNYLESI